MTELTLERMSKLAWCAALCATLSIVTPEYASAESEAVLTLRGTISPSCEITFGGSASSTIDNIELASGGQAQEAVQVDCNTAFTGTVRSENGAFVNFAAEQTNQTGGVSRIPYVLTMNLPGLDTIGPFESADLVTEKSFDSGIEVLFRTTGDVVLDWDGDKSAYSGDYEDRIFFTVSSRR